MIGLQNWNDLWCWLVKILKGEGRGGWQKASMLDVTFVKLVWRLWPIKSQGWLRGPKVSCQSTQLNPWFLWPADDCSTKREDLTTETVEMSGMSWPMGSPGNLNLIPRSSNWWMTWCSSSVVFAKMIGEQRDYQDKELSNMLGAGPPFGQPTFRHSSLCGIWHDATCRPWTARLPFAWRQIFWRTGGFGWRWGDRGDLVLVPCTKDRNSYIKAEQITVAGFPMNKAPLFASEASNMGSNHIVPQLDQSVI